MQCFSEFNDDLQVNHINGIKSDNRLLNLEMVTASENVKHSFNVLNRKGSVTRSVLTKEQILEIRDLYNNGWAQSKIEMKFKLNRGSVWPIVHNKSWKEVL